MDMSDNITKMKRPIKKYPRNSDDGVTSLKKKEKNVQKKQLTSQNSISDEHHAQ
jgi:hypothetical protein